MRHQLASLLAIAVFLGIAGLSSATSRPHVAYPKETATHSDIVTSNRYIHDKYLPDKHIDVIDEAGGRVRHRREPFPLGDRPIHGTHVPSKPIDVIDETGGRVRHRREPFPLGDRPIHGTHVPSKPIDVIDETGGRADI
ncbi:hypothetical protein OIDMADRAFT_178760 [Oidiodendron maius Zn]|uniref:ClpA/ClpB AAA lid domain-containing protein n=1 Tax=Oidiodendron maius (strain Zn) TaxID=913774 RepID=A0A0C3DLV1_OIDMZ|nr:hypothetical protein OIDMADRAFT_178760 [Oidiodendron maius Zn]